MMTMSRREVGRESVERKLWSGSGGICQDDFVGLERGRPGSRCFVDGISCGGFDVSQSERFTSIQSSCIALIVSIIQQKQGPCGGSRPLTDQQPQGTQPTTTNQPTGSIRNPHQNFQVDDQPAPRRRSTRLRGSGKAMLRRQSVTVIRHTTSHLAPRPRYYRHQPLSVRSAVRPTSRASHHPTNLPQLYPRSSSPTRRNSTLSTSKAGDFPSKRMRFVRRFVETVLPPHQLVWDPD